ncbi:MAG: hypothetical protein ACI9IP_003559 [Arcticibacterium sp.]|jgi:hypothetical protein
MTLEQLALEIYIERFTEEGSRRSLSLDIRDYFTNKHWYPNCISSFKLTSGALIYTSNSPELLEASIIDLKKYIINPPGKTRYPRVYVSRAFSLDKETFVINLVEVKSFWGLLIT